MSVFVDTGAWYASAVPSDPNHARTLDWLRRNSIPLLTTDYIVDETLTLLRARGESARSITLGTHFFDLHLVNVLSVAPDHLDAAWTLFKRQPLRRWSFTDCTSKAVMDALHIRKALTFDRHFAEFGGVEIVP